MVEAHLQSEESAMFKHLSSVVCLFLAAVCAPAHTQNAAKDRFVYFYPSVYRISPQGQITSFHLPENEEIWFSVVGGIGPVISRDERWIAFTKDNDLWLYNTRTQTKRRATRVGRPYAKKFASVLALVVSWSADSTRVLIKVTPGDTECVDCDDRGDWKPRKANYGYFAYSVSNGALSKVHLPDDFAVWEWRADGRL